MRKPITTWLAMVGALLGFLLLAGVRLQSVSAAYDVVRIEAGWFTMGANAGDVAFAQRLCAEAGDSDKGCESTRFKRETPAHRVYVSAYRIDRMEVSQGAYKRCVLANRCAPPRVLESAPHAAQNNLPVAAITWFDAQRYCAWVKGRLPTEAEWERAARGASERRFPWGRTFNPRLAHSMDALVTPGEHAAPVSAYTDGRSFYGLLQMAGNVWEYTADRYAETTYRKSERVNPKGSPTGDARVVRGGSWRSPAYTLRVTHREKRLPNTTAIDLGFRCAYDI
jgi:formylglycine-generating enzyme required for sulfatase activity